ncbi:hypothetical protein J1N35_021841, partial [Gossypium stocksii]
RSVILQVYEGYAVNGWSITRALVDCDYAGTTMSFTSSKIHTKVHYHNQRESGQHRLLGNFVAANSVTGLCNGFDVFGGENE